MKRLIALLLAFSLIACPVFADAEEEPCEHFRVWADWNEILSTETLDGEQHRITAVCPDCGETVYLDEAHDFTLSDAEPYDSEQHRSMKSCADCGYGAYIYSDHVWEYGDWQSVNEGLYCRTAVCAECGAEKPTPEFYEAEDEDTELPEEASEQREPESPEIIAVPEETSEPELPELPSETAEPSDVKPAISESENSEETLPALWEEQPSETMEPDVASYPVAVISVTVPDNLPLTATGDGYVYAIDNLCIVNHSDGAVKIRGITVDAADGWTLAPYTGSISNGDAAVKSIGFYINGAVTMGYGNSEFLYLPGDWTIAKGASLPLSYTATVSFADIPQEGEQVLSLTFIMEWA